MGKDGEPLKKQLSALLALCLGTLCVLSSLAWRRAERQAAEWKTRAEAAERRAIQAETAQEDSEAQRRLLSLEDDPIAAFFSPFPYSGATARYLATLETNAYRTELENAAELLGNNSDGVPVDAFLTFIDAQAQAEADAWTASLEAQGAMTAGAWAHVDQCQIPICQSTGPLSPGKPAFSRLLSFTRLPFSLDFSLMRKFKGKPRQPLLTTLSRSLALERFASLVA